MDIRKIGYYGSTAVMCLIFAFSAGMYFLKYDMVVGFFEHLGYPVYLIYPLAVAKILGIIAVLWRPSRLLTEWAYAGFFFDAVLATAAHVYAGEPAVMSGVALVETLMSRGLLVDKS